MSDPLLSNVSTGVEGAPSTLLTRVRNTHALFLSCDGRRRLLTWTGTPTRDAITDMTYSTRNPRTTVLPCKQRGIKWDTSGYLGLESQVKA